MMGRYMGGVEWFNGLARVHGSAESGLRRRAGGFGGQEWAVDAQGETVF